MTSEVGDAIRELAHVVKTEDEIEGIALQVDDLWNRVQAQAAYHLQIATQEPAGAPGVDSAGRGASGGLDGAPEGEHTPEPQHDHQWVTVTTYEDTARGYVVQQCTLPGCGVKRDMAAGGIILGLPTSNPFRPEDRA